MKIVNTRPYPEGIVYSTIIHDSASEASFTYFAQSRNARDLQNHLL